MCKFYLVTAYSDIERGKTVNFTLSRLFQIANVLDVPVEKIINRHSLQDNENVLFLRKELETIKSELQKAKQTIAYLRGGG